MTATDGSEGIVRLEDMNLFERKAYMEVQAWSGHVKDILDHEKIIGKIVIDNFWIKFGLKPDYSEYWREARWAKDHDKIGEITLSALSSLSYKDNYAVYEKKDNIWVLKKEEKGLFNFRVWKGFGEVINPKSQEHKALERILTASKRYKNN